MTSTDIDQSPNKRAARRNIHLGDLITLFPGSRQFQGKGALTEKVGEWKPELNLRRSMVSRSKPIAIVAQFHDKRNWLFPWWQQFQIWTWLTRIERI
jgi:hypothetical protein